MKKAFAVSFYRFKKSRIPIILSTALLVVLAVSTGILLSRTGGGAPESAFTDEYREYLLHEKRQYEEELSDPDIESAERHDIEMALAKVEYFLETESTRGNYYNDTPGDGGAYWMQIYFLFGAFTSAIAAVIVTVWFYTGTKTGIHRTESLTGRSRSSLWLGKNGAAASVAFVTPLIFTIIMFICALCSSDTRFLVEDDMTTRVYSVSVFAQWALQAVSLFAVTAVSSAIASFVTTVSGDSAAGTSVSLLILLLTTLGTFVTFNAFKDIAPDNLTSTFIPYIGIILIPFRCGISNAFIIALCAHIAIAVVLYLLSYMLYRRKTL